MSQRSDDLYFVDIIEAADSVREFIKHATRETFVADEALRSAVLWKLYIVAEAVTRLSEQAEESALAATWQQVRGFRNRLAHGYFALDPERVWSIAIQSLPELATSIEAILTVRFPETARQLHERRKGRRL